MNGFADLRMFSEIARCDSMAIAAGRLGMAPATISGRLKALEDHYGVSLVRRTTRSLSLTDEGRLLLERAQPILWGFAELEREMGGRKADATGSLVLSSPVDFGRRHLLPLVQAFSRSHPQVLFSLQFDAASGESGHHFDVAFRTRPVRDSQLITRKLMELERVTCASPAYLAQHGCPATPADLAAHECLRLTDSACRGDDWTFRVEGRLESVVVRGRYGASDPDALTQLALQGQGVLRTFAADVADFIRAGALVQILSDFEPPPQAVCLLSESRQRLPLRTVQFIDFALDFFRRGEAAGAPIMLEGKPSKLAGVPPPIDGVKFFFLQNLEKEISSIKQEQVHSGF